MEETLKNVIIQAEQGNVEAMMVAGDCFLRGIYTDRDEQKANFYYKMAADAGDAKASLAVAIDLIGGKKDKKNGIKYLQYAADNGVAHAQYMLGLMYASGEICFFGKERKAIKYIEMSARQGVAKAQIELFVMIVKNKNYTLDDMIFWLVCAYLHTSEKDTEEREIAVKNLNRLISSGVSKDRIDQVIMHVKKNYPQYLITPPPTE